MVKKIVLLGLLGILSCKPNSQKAPEETVKEEKTPNVVLIYTDDLGYGDITPYGGKVPTPNIDRLAKGGIVHRNAYAAAATCTPSRYSLLTGEYAWRQKGRDIAPGDANALIPSGHQTVATIFKNAGYKTAAIGKWHLGLGETGKKIDWNTKLTNTPNDIGFDYSYIIPATGDRVPCVFMENGSVVNLDPNDPITVSYKEKVGDWPTGKENPELLKLHPSPGQGHDNTIVNGISRIGYQTGGKAALWRDEDIADDLTKRTVNFIKENKEQPFFVYLATNDIHVPRMPHERFQGKTPQGLRGDAILELDYTVGEVLKTLDELNLTENTVIIFSSDNGPVLDDGYADEAVQKTGDHDPSGSLRGGKYSAYEAGTRVPLIISWKGKINPGESNALISQIDFLGTMAQLTGQSYTKETAPDTQEQWSIWSGSSSTNGREYVVQEAIDGTLSITNGTYKYISPSDGDKVAWQTGIETGFMPKPQLYNIKTDRGEKDNLAEKEPSILDKLKAQLSKIVNR